VGGAVWELGAVAVAVGAPVVGAVGAMGAVVVLAVCKQAVRVGVLVLVGAVCNKAVGVGAVGALGAVKLRKPWEV
jgi:hypothetical protein